MSKIEFTAMPAPLLPSQDSLSIWLRACVAHYGYSCKNISYTYYEEESIRALNKTVLRHDYSTDILTFCYAKPALVVEIFLCWPIILDNAKQLALSPKDELHRVMVHGLLHCMGFDDSNETQTDAMRSAEDYCLSLRPKILKDSE